MNRYQKMNPLVWHRKQIGLALFVLLALVSARPFWRALAAAGDLDTSFGGDGTVVEFVTGIPSPHIAIQHDGKVVELMRYWSGNGYSLQLCRRVLDGTPDATFSGDGYVTTGENNFIAVDSKDVTVQPNGKIVIVGTYDEYFNQSVPKRLAVLRYLANGNLDTSFSSDGKLFGPANTKAFSVAIQPDGKILIGGGYTTGGALIARYDANGNLDSSFGSQGYIILPASSGGSFYKVILQSNGGILAANDQGIRHYSASGIADPFFGGGGILQSTITDFALLSDGKIVTLANGSLIQRWNTSGYLDFTFSATTLSCPTCGAFTSIALQENGKVIVGGNAITSTSPANLARVNSAGGLDTSFGVGGYRESVHNELTDVALMADQRIVAAGWYYPTTPAFPPAWTEFTRYRNDITGTTDVSVGPITTSPTTVNPGDTVTYTIPVNNLSANKAAHVTMKTNVPSGTSYVGAAVQSGWAVLQQPSAGAMGAVSASAYELAPGATANLFMVVKVPATAAHGSTVSMSATVSNTIADSQPFNNTAYKVISVQ